MSTSILDFDSEVFCEAEYGIFVSDSSKDVEMMDTLKSLTQPFIQNGGSLTLVADLYRTKNPASFQRKLEQYENEMRESQQKAQEAQMEVENAKVEMEKYKIDADNQTKIEVALIGRGEDTSDIERQKIAITKEKTDKESTQKASELDEEKRHNKESEDIDRLKARSVSKTK
jgi:hypothetical protein